MAKKNGHGSSDAILEKILGEMQKMNSGLADVRRELHEFREDTNVRLDRLDVRVQLMSLGYQDLRDRVTTLEKKQT